MNRHSLFSLAVLATLILGASGCASVDDDLAGKVFEEILDSNVSGLAWAMAWRSLVFGVLGLLLGLGVFFGLRHIQAFRLSWEHAKWVRGVTGALYVLAFAGTGAYLGFWKGAIVGSEEMILEGQIGKDVLPIAGDAGSLMIASIYVGSEMLDEGEASFDDAQVAKIGARVTEYGEGEWSMGTEELQARLVGVRNRVVEIGTEVARREIYDRHPELEGTLADDIIPWTLDKLGNLLADEALKAALETDSVEPIEQVFARLDEAAAREDQPAMLSHVELRDHVVEVGLVPLVMQPIRSFCRGQQVIGLIVLVVFLVVTIGGFQLAHHLYEKNQREQNQVA